MQLLGQPIRRTEDPRFLTGGATYVADLDLPGAAVVTYVVSQVAHARIDCIDVDAARALPGVLDVVVAADLDVGPLPPVNPSFPEAMGRPLLADGVVRFVGEPVVAIVSETAAIGADAAELVIVDWAPLPAVATVEAASDGEVLLFPAAGTNVALHATGGSGDATPDGSEVVVRATFRSPASPLRRSRPGRRHRGGSRTGASRTGSAARDRTLSATCCAGSTTSRSTRSG